MVIKFNMYDIVATPAEVLELLTLDNKEDEVEVKEVKPAKPKQVRGPYKKVLDVGKMQALRDAGWSYEKIADEMRCGASTVYKKLKKEA